MEIVKNGLKEF